MIKTLIAANHSEREKFSIPRSVQQSLPIQRIYRDGIWQVGGKYSKAWRFADINYALASREDQEKMFHAYCALINSLPTDAATKITVNNRRLNDADFRQTVLMPMRGDGLDGYRIEYNDIVSQKAAESNNLVQDKYITISLPRGNIEEARSYFNRVGTEIEKSFSSLGSGARPLANHERLRIFHDFFRPGEEEFFAFDLGEAMRRGDDFRDHICPESLRFHADHFEMGGKVGRVLFLREYASYIRDDLISNLSDFQRSLMLSIDVLPIPTGEAVKEIQSRILGIETDITRWQNKQNSRNNFSAAIPYDLEQLRDEAKEFLGDLSGRDQRMIFANITLVHTADDLAQLDADTETLQSIAREQMCQFAVLRYQQEDGLNTALPYGLRRIKTTRTLTTESTAVLMPFRVQEIQDAGGIYYGVNAVSRNLLICNRKRLINGGGFIVGVSGAGKSMAAKGELINVALSSDDDILVIDPDGEYAPLITALGGTAVKISASSDAHINAMNINADYAGDDDPVRLKSEFVLSLCDQLMGGGQLGAQERSVIDRCVSLVYKDYIAAKYVGEAPTLRDLHSVLCAQPEEEARDIALAIELFSTGNLNIFSHQTNVDLSSRILCFDLLDLGKQLRPVAMLVVLDAIVNRVTANRKKGKRTWILIDEVRLFFDSEYSASFLERAWLNFRKFGGLPTGLVQNAEKCLSGETARFLFGNSEFLIILKQQPTDLAQLVPLLRLSEAQANFVRSADAGCGLIRYGGSVIPFRNEFPTDAQLYKLMTTAPSEQ